MHHYYIFEARSGLRNWYGCPSGRFKHLVKKNLVFAEKVFGVKSLCTTIKNSSLRLVIEDSDGNTLNFINFLLQNLNKDVLAGSGGINIFSGGVDLCEVTPDHSTLDLPREAS